MRTSQRPTVALPEAATLPNTRPRATSTRDSGAGHTGPVILERYRLHRRLGGGGFGTVWLARDERLDRDVAVKILPPDRIVGGRFEREAHAAARLAHPGIVTLYEAAIDEEGAYLVSELVRGSTLDELLEAGRLSDRDIVAIGIAMCDALAHAHAQGVVHRDVKPSNVLVPEQPSTPAQVARLTDFGVARVIGGDSLTRTGDVVGTAAYMAPEQAEGREAGAAADLYSLTLVIYEALTGVNPLRTGTAAQRARRLGAHLPPLRRQRRELPRELGAAVDLALRPRPRERGSVDELRNALSLCLEEVQDRRGVVTSAWAPRPERSRQDEPRPAVERFQPKPGAPRLEEQPDRAPLAWPERALGGAAAAAIAAWLVAVVMAPAPLAPAIVALVAGLLVAALPRVGWLVLAAALSGSLGLQNKPGGALLVLLAALVPLVTLLRHPPSWPLPVAAPALGIVGLGGAWPALAGRAGTVWQRAALGITGWLWLAIAIPLANRGIYIHALAGIPTRSMWMPSLYETSHHVLTPLLSSGVLTPAPVWGIAAAVLPWIVRRRSLLIDVVVVTIWSAGLASATTTVLRLAHAGAVVNSTSVVVGAVAGGIVALGPTVFARLRAGRRSGYGVAGLA